MRVCDGYTYSYSSIQYMPCPPTWPHSLRLPLTTRLHVPRLLHGCTYHGQALKLPCALREFEASRGAGITDAPKPPTIVGFREHIFSGLGLLGDLAASSELCFGTLVQALSPRPLIASSHRVLSPASSHRVFTPAFSHRVFTPRTMAVPTPLRPHYGPPTAAHPRARRPR